MRRRVAIIGGGISGLAAAHHLRQISPETDLLLIESSHRLGGVIQTTRKDGFLVEDAADNFMTTPPSAVKLCQQLGLGYDLICTAPGRRQAMVVRAGRLVPIPAGFLVMAPSRIWPLILSGVLSPLGKLRAGCEIFVPRRKGNEDESLKSFVTRRFGREMFERLVQPLVGGIYTADPSRLSVAATMPRFIEMERQQGSLIRAMLRRRWSARDKPEQSGGARYGQFMSLRGGMSSLIDALAKELPVNTIKLDSPVCCVVASKGRWSILMKHDQPSDLEVDAVIVAVPAKHAWGMLSTVDPTIAEELRKIEYASCAVLSVAYRREQIGRSLESFGFVVPLSEQRFILSCSFSSLKYDGRAPDGTVLMRVFIGGACQSDLLDFPDHQLMEMAEWELAKFLAIEGKPLLRRITRQTEAMPQYHLGHLERVATINARLEMFPTLALAGNSLGGVGIPACIESGTAAANRVFAAMESKASPRVESACN